MKKQLNIKIGEKAENKLRALKIAFKVKHERNITYIEIFSKLLEKAKLKDIE